MSNFISIILNVQWHLIWRHVVVSYFEISSGTLFRVKLYFYKISDFLKCYSDFSQMIKKLTVKARHKLAKKLKFFCVWTLFVKILSVSDPHQQNLAKVFTFCVRRRECFFCKKCICSKNRFPRKKNILRTNSNEY